MDDFLTERETSSLTGGCTQVDRVEIDCIIIIIILLIICIRVFNLISTIAVQWLKVSLS